MLSKSILGKGLIVGLGSIGQRHLKNIMQMYGDIELIVYRHEENKDLDIHGIKHITNDLVEALDHKPDFAIICNPSPFHVDIAIEIAHRGVHLLIEKPISSSTERVEELIALSKEKKIKLMVGYNLRFLESLNFFRQSIQDGIIGEIFSIKADVGQNLKYWRKNQDYTKGVSANKNLGGGALLELSHEFDYISWIFGPVEWVSGVIGKKSNLTIDVEDFSTSTLGFKDKNYVANINIDLFRHDSHRECIVIGEEGTIKWNALENSVMIFSKSEKSWKTIFNESEERDSSYREELKHFLDCILKDQEPLIDGHSALNVLEIIEAIRNSSRDGKVVPV